MGIARRGDTNMTPQQLYDLFQTKLVMADQATSTSVKDKSDNELFSLPFVEKALVIWDKARQLRNMPQRVSVCLVSAWPDVARHPPSTFLTIGSPCCLFSQNCNRSPTTG